LKQNLDQKLSSFSGMLFEVESVRKKHFLDVSSALGTIFLWTH